MALKVLMLRSRLAPLQTELQTLETTRDGFAAREAELEHDIAEAQTDEERSVVEAAVNAFEQERSANAADITRVQERINEINEEIRSLEEAQTPPASDPPAAEPTGTTNTERSNHSMPINNPDRRWFGLTYAERDTLMQTEQVRTFIRNVREARAQQRSVTGGELGMPSGTTTFPESSARCR